MSIRCFVSSFTDFKAMGGPNRFISAVIDQHFTVINNKLVARGEAYLHSGIYENYTKGVILEISYAEYAKKFVVNVFWEAEWLDGYGTPMTQSDREKAAGVCNLGKAEEKAIKFFQKEANEMLERILYYHWDELKQVLKIED